MYYVRRKEYISLMRSIFFMEIPHSKSCSSCGMNSNENAFLGKQKTHVSILGYLNQFNDMEHTAYVKSLFSSQVMLRNQMNQEHKATGNHHP